MIHIVDNRIITTIAVRGNLLWVFKSNGVASFTISFSHTSKTVVESFWTDTKGVKVESLSLRINDFLLNC